MLANFYLDAHSLFQDIPPISITEVKTTDGAFCLELKVRSKSRLREGFWHFLDKFGFRYGDTFCRPLLPYEVNFSLLLFERIHGVGLDIYE